MPILTKDPKKSPKRDELKAMFHFRPDTGKLYHKPRSPDLIKGASNKHAERVCKSWNTKFAYKEAGSIGNHGYRTVKVHGKSYLAHRIIYFIMTGIWPIEVDHLDHDPLNNRWRNLRNVPHSENGRNKSMNKRNRSGCNGVQWYERGKCWRVQLTIKGKVTHIGYFKERSKAVAASKEAMKRWGYAENHGKPHAETYRKEAV